MKPSLPLAVQMYTLRDDCARDFEGTLRAVSRIGYRGVELAGWNGMSAMDLRKLLDSLQLMPVAQHVGYDQLRNLKEDFIQDSIQLGMPYWVCPYLAEGDREGVEAYREVARVLNDVGAKLKARGIQLCYHNHAFEFERFEERTALQWIFDTAAVDHLHAELDVYWVKKGGEDPLDWIRRLGKRCALLHLKDMRDDGSFAEVGAGNLDFSAILEMAVHSGVRGFVVEQDVCPGPPLDSLAISFGNIKRIAPTLI